MDTFELLAHVRRLGGQIRAENGHLRVSLPQGLLTPELKAQIAQHKAAIVSILEAAQASDGAEGPAPVRVSRSEKLPLSFAQQRLWFLHQFIGAPESYNVGQAFRLRGDLDIGALKSALDGLFTRHEPLRTRFVAVDGTPFQEIGRERAPQIRAEALEIRQGDDPASAAIEAAVVELERPFDFTKELPVRVRLWRMADGDHFLLLVLHHMITDGWSVSVLKRDLAALYSAAARRTQAALPDLRFQYADFAAWQRDWLQGRELDRLVSYWKQTLGGGLLLELPLDRPRPPTRSYRGAIDDRHLDVDLTTALEALGRRAGASLYMTMLAAFVVLLQRYTRQEEIIVGSPIGNRGRPEFEDLTGCFLNMLVLRTDASGDPSFLELVERVRQVAMGAFGHQGLPFERLVEELGVQRDLSVNPLFQVFFAVQNAPAKALEFSGLAVDEVELPRRFTNFDLDVHVMPVDGRLRVAFVYSTDVFDPGTIGAMGRAFESLLRSIVKDAGAAISTLELQETAAPILSPGARGKAMTLPEQGGCIHELVRTQIELAPAAVAVRFERQALTYGDLGRRVAEVAARLAAAGVREDVAVGLCVERGLDMPAAMLAILTAGGAYLPLDPGLPADRLQYMLEDSGAGIVLTQGRLTPLLAAFPGRIVLLDETEPAAAPASLDTRALRPGSLAYVIYTSGSTGRPKGVEVTHESVVNFLTSMREVPGIDAGDTLLAVTTISFDIAGLELFLPLTVGACVEVVSKAVVSDGHLLRQALDTSAATIMQATPATWQMLIHAGWKGSDRLRILCGGEALPRVLANELVARGRELWNMYGPTETTIWSAVSKVGADDEPISIGAPIANTQLLVLDARLRPVPQGMPGELFIAGAGLARGYRNRQDLTAERFVPSPRPGEVPGRMYRTGDWVRHDAQGRLRFLGRIDDQVKLRGFRIELGEIESVLCQHPGVRQASALIAGDPGEDPRLVAYWIPRASQDPAPYELRDFLRTRLPEYMLPTAFVKLDEFPLSPAGKVDRRRLKEIRPAAILEDAVRQSMDTPRGPVEEAVAEAFRDVLRLDRVGSRQDFFALGGHSLLATRLVSRIRNVFQVELTLRQVFEAPTVAELAKCIESARRGGRQGGAGPIAILPRDRALPLSFAQNRLWLIDQMGGGAGYHIRMELDLHGPLDKTALEQALNAIVARHETLRTRFVQSEGVPRQVVDHPRSILLAWNDRTDVKTAGRESAMAAYAAEEDARPYDLERGPLFRAAVVEFRSDDHVLSLSFHHIVADGWSFGLLRDEIAELYDAITSKRPPALPPLQVQYADFASWHRSWLTDESLDEQFSYWKRQLAGELPTLELPTDRPRPPVQSFAGAAHRLVMGKALHDGLTALAREHHATLAMVCLAGFQALLARYTGQSDILVGTPIANRTREELEGLIGFFVNSLVMRADVDTDPAFEEFLRQVRDTSLAAYDHQDLPFEKLVDEIDPSRDTSRTPLFQVVFAMHAPEVTELDCGGLRMCVRAADTSVTRFDLELHVFDGSVGLEAAWVYSTALFDAATIEQMARHYETLLAGAVKTPRARISELPLLPADELRAAVRDWNDTAVEITGSGCVHKQIEEQSTVRPEAPAAVFHDSRLTYAQLNARANQAARVLRAMGVERDMLVGLCVHRGLDMVVGMLAILKAGGAYVPLDPTYPADRLAFMLTDAQVKILVTQESVVGGLPEHGARVLCLDGDRERFDSELDTNLDVDSTPEDLAYAIFTSGSTGQPKAALLRHRGLCNVSQEQARAFGLKPGARCLQFASLSFDASTFEVVMALANGGTLYLGDRDELLPGPDLLGFLRRHAIEVVTLPPTALSALPFEDLTALRTITVAGEACPAELVERWAPGRRFFNLYGPTEATIWSTMAELTAGEEPHIGKPIGNTQVYLLDAHMNPVPVGVPGEICIGGVGLARGYFNRPQLTAERFIENPFVNRERLYKTGDRARRRPDGNIEFMGRIDHQVKLRGYRIELGEIESTLSQHPAVRQCLAVVREDLPGDRRLVAYVVHDPEPGAAVMSTTTVDWEAEHVAQWKALYEGSYGEAPTPADTTFNITSWNSSYTNAPIPAPEMREWVDQTVDAILATRPDRVLELGCGMGLLLFRVAPHCKEYHGVDLSRAALSYIERHLTPDIVGHARVTVEVGAADDTSKLPVGHYDTVILNSVVQYFPSIHYLVRVIEGAVTVLRPGGRIFVGDVRSLPLLRAFHTSVQLFKSKGELDIPRLRQRVHQQMNQDQELVISPEFFVALRDHVPRIRRVGIEPKRGRYDNELGRFRYDVLLELDDAAVIQDAAVLWTSWGEAGIDLDRLRERLRKGAPSVLGIRGIPNRRTQRDVLAADRLFADDGPQTEAVLLRELEAATGGIDPDEVRELCRELSYTCAMSWADSRADGSFDAVFRPRTLTDPPIDPLAASPTRSTRRRPWREYANEPLRGRLARELVPALRQHMASRVPDYMLPSAFVVLDAFPVTPNGKIDRRALPAPDSLRTELASTFVAPRGKVEEALAEVWARVLNVERVGAHDNFFELGGDSILCIHVVAAARAAGLHFAAKDLFQNPTVSGLGRVARAVSTMSAEQGPVSGDAPLTPIQHWYFEQDLAEPHHFNQSLLFELGRTLDAGRIEAGLRDVVNHHDALRLRFRREGGTWKQEVGPPLDRAPLEIHDLSSAALADQERQIEATAARLQGSLDLASGVLLTSALFQMGTGSYPPFRLLLVIHHLAIDAVSWAPLLQDLQHGIQGRREDNDTGLPLKTSSYQAWSRALLGYAQSAAVSDQAGHWLRLPWHDVRPLRFDRPAGINTVASLASVECALSESQTHALVHVLPAAVGAEINSILLTALARTLAPWTHHELVLVDLEGHGREDVFEGLDVSRTVGWFTAIYPVLLHAKDGEDAASTLRRVHADLAAYPNHGLTFGVARYLSPDTNLTSQLRALPQPQLAFGYLGQLDGALGARSLRLLRQAPIGPSRGLRNRRLHAIEVNTGVLEGRLQMSWSYSTALHDKPTIDHLAQQFSCELLDLLALRDSGHPVTRSAEPLTNTFGWSAEDIDDLLGDLDKGH